MEDTTSSRLSWNENPVQIVGAIEVIIAALLTLSLAFGANPELAATVAAVASAIVGGVTGLIVREKVTPYNPAPNPKSMVDPDDPYIT